MKPISATLKSHLESETTTLATCWKIIRQDQAVLGFTSHSKDIVYDGVTYQATTGFTPSAIESHSGLSIDQLEVEAVIDSGAISDNDIHAGLYDFSEIEIFMVNYLDLTQGILSLRRGWLGEIQYNARYFSVEVRGLTQKLSQNIGELYSPRCRAKLGDARCGVDLNDFTDTGQVETVVNQREFADSTLSAEDGYYNYGLITFTSGYNEGLSMEVKRYQAGSVELVMPLPYVLAVGDQYTIIAGCDKRFSTCKNVFGNAINFRGEPSVPGNDRLLSGK